MSDVRAGRASGGVSAPVGHANAILKRALQNITVEIVEPTRLRDLQAGWAELLGRAEAPNVFMDPALIAAAAEAAPETPQRVLAAWKPIEGRRRLVGLWAFAIGPARWSMLPLKALSAPTFAHCYLATPVIDRNHLEDTLEAMLDCVADDPRLPKVIALDAIATEGTTYAALVRVLAERGSTPCVFEQARRPALASTLDGKSYLAQALSASSRKKLRQHRRRLAEKGTLRFVIDSEPATMRDALEQFLAMEAAGWKGRQGTALLSDPSDAAFIRGAVGALADHGSAAIHSLQLDGTPVSMQIVVRAGSVAFTWKTTYDEAFQDFSPGMLLLEDYTAAFLADKSIALVDSCSFDDSGFMGVWTERQAVADLWIDARRGGSLEFRALSGLQKSYRDARAAAKTMYLKWRKARGR